MYYQNGRTPGPQGAQISHITLGYHDLAVSAAFYAACLSTIGLTRLPAEEADESEAAFGYDGTRTPVVFVQAPFDGRPATWGNGTHVAFAAKTRAEVHAFHEAALAAGGVCEGPPGPRPQYSQRYYAAYMRDPMGQKLQIVTRNTDG
ncbi:MAG: VOC family protein [Pseudomonadota bacterium]